MCEEFQSILLRILSAGYQDDVQKFGKWQTQLRVITDYLFLPSLDKTTATVPHHQSWGIMGVEGSILRISIAAACLYCLVFSSSRDSMQHALLDLWGAFLQLYIWRVEIFKRGKNEKNAEFSTQGFSFQLPQLFCANHDKPIQHYS